jgi:hypothetical protein
VVLHEEVDGLVLITDWLMAEQLNTASKTDE